MGAAHWQERVGHGTVVRRRTRGVRGDRTDRTEQPDGSSEQQDDHPPVRPRALARTSTAPCSTSRWPGSSVRARARRGLLRRRRPHRGGGPGGPSEPAGAGDRAGRRAPEVVLWLQVRDVHAAIAQLAEAGVAAVRPPTLEPWGLVEAWIDDPDGRRIHLVEVPADHPLRRDVRGAVRWVVHRSEPRRGRVVHDAPAVIGSWPSTTCSWPCLPGPKPMPERRPSTRACSVSPGCPSHPAGRSGRRLVRTGAGSGPPRGGGGLPAGP